MSSRRMNEATLRRLQQRVMEEGYKVPEEESATSSNNTNDNNDNPALHDIAGAVGVRQQTIPSRINNNYNNAHVVHNQVLSEEEHEAYLLEQYRRQLELEEAAARSNHSNKHTRKHMSSNSNSKSMLPKVDPNEIDLDEFAELYGDVGVGGDAELIQSSSAAVRQGGVWQCDCGYQVAMQHNFCGVCGQCKPQDWWCSTCENENPHYHRFCFCCGSPNSHLLSLDYEDDEPVPTSVLHQRQLYASAATGIGGGGTEVASVLTDEEEEESQQAAALMSAHDIMPPPLHHQPWLDHHHHQEDGSLSFVDDSGNQQQLQQPSQPSTTTTSKAWTCLTCTFLNENETFLSCEMCGSCRPVSPIPGDMSSTQALHDSTSKLPVQGQESFSNQSQASEKKESRFTDIMARQLSGASYESSAVAAAGHQQQQQQQQQPPTKEDLELAMIYAQQERMLAEYQSGKS